MVCARHRKLCHVRGKQVDLLTTRTPASEARLDYLTFHLRNSMLKIVRVASIRKDTGITGEKLCIIWPTAARHSRINLTRKDELLR